MNSITRFIGKTSMYWLMSYFLLFLIALSMALSALNILPYIWWQILLCWVILTISSISSNWILSKLFEVQVNFESQLVTTDILTLILGSLNPLLDWEILVAAAVVAQASKYIINYNKRHIFNPAAFAVVAIAVANLGGASWWVGNQYLLPAIILGGIFITRKLPWLHLILSFLLTYIVLLAIQMQDITALVNFLKNSPVFFFAFVMLIEPLTAPAGKLKRIYYGILIAFALFILQKYTELPYTLELALLIGNLAAFATRKEKSKMILKFTEKKPAAQNIYEFWFSAGGGSSFGGEPIRKINFFPGQFLEWNLPHEKPDNRGMRRWFTIAASPTEDKIMLTTKLSKKSSTFKTALNKLTPGQKITTTDPDGEFVLPKDENKKLVFIAGGIGITPFRSMTKDLLDRNQKRDIVLVYSVKTENEIAFADIWNQAKEKMGLKPVFVVTDKVGYVNPEMIKKEVPDWNSRIFYVSGPEPMVEAFEKMLAVMGIKNNNIIRDYFPGYVETYN